MLHLQPPENFPRDLAVVGCFVEYDGKILLLHRSPHKPQGNTWAIPAGKVEGDEPIEQALVRELWEETGIQTEPSALEFLHTFYCSFQQSKLDFVYHVFKLKLDEQPMILREEKAHQAFAWKTPDQALELNLIEDMNEVVRLIYKI
jgi:mutator protein MutT